MFLSLKHFFRQPVTGSRFSFCCLIIPMILAGCTARASVSGLKPQYPSVAPVANEWINVSSLQPILRWETFPHQRPLIKDSGEMKDRITDVTYELKIWRSLGENPGPLVYSRYGLSGSVHQVDIPLESSTVYYWSVRARFRLDGKLRGNEWSTLIHSDSGAKDDTAGFWYSDPNKMSYFLVFKTPSK